jgi:hypothetical protein
MSEGDEKLKVARLLIDTFAGREGIVSVQTGAAAFAPETVKINPTRLALEHLSGKRCFGVYLMDAENRVRCSCVDFDNKLERPDPLYREKAEKVAFLLNSLGLAALVEVSQSGMAAHVWLIFDKPTDAWIVRAFWKRVAEKLEIAFTEIYPRQDKVRDGGIGNMVRYPLWNLSHFVDVENEWARLDAIAALEGVIRVCGADLALIAFQSGLGQLTPELAPHLAVIETGDSLPARVARLLDGGSSLLAKRWEGEKSGLGDNSRSAVAQSLCCELVRMYVPTPEIVAALRVWLKRHDPDGKYDREGWINGTVAKAYDYVTKRKETKSVTATTFHAAAHAYIDRIEQGHSFFVPSGIPELDASIDGVGPGEVAIIAGRPNHGKSAIGFQWLAHAASLGVNGLVISEEMSHTEIGKRRLMSISNVPQDHWVPAVASRLRRDVDQYHRGKGDVFIVESSQSIDRIDDVIDQFAQLYNVGIVMVDYLQLVSAKGEGRYEIVTEVSKRLKQAARRNNVAVLGMCQLNRQVEGRDDNEPKNSDLKESGGIEQDADLIVFGQYPKRFRADADDDEYRLIVSKRRNGPIREARIITKFDPAKQVIGGMVLPASLLDL